MFFEKIQEIMKNKFAVCLIQSLLLFFKIYSKIMSDNQKERLKNMRIRYKKWARPELEASKFYIDEPEEIKGKWKEQFENATQPLHLELRLW